MGVHTRTHTRRLLCAASRSRSNRPTVHTPSPGSLHLSELACAEVGPDDEQTISHSVVVNASAETLYDMVADINRMGEWSNTCTGATWDEGYGPVPSEGAWFTGHNVVGDRIHDAHCEFVAAERPTTIAWMQGGRVDGVTEWRYRFAPVDGGIEVTETWTQVRPFPPGRVDDEMAKQMRRAFDHGIRETLSKLQASAEAS